MKIYVKGLEDERFLRPLQLISDLFFEESDVSFTPNQEDLQITFTLTVNEQISAHISLEARDDDKVYTEELSKPNLIGLLIMSKFSSKYFHLIK